MEEISREPNGKIIETAVFHLENVLDDLKKQRIGGKYSLDQFAEEVLYSSDVELSESEKQQALSDVIDFVLRELQVDLNRSKRYFYLKGQAFIFFKTTWSPNIYLRATAKDVKAKQVELYYELSNWFVPDDNDPGADIYVKQIGEVVINALLGEMKTAINFLDDPETGNVYEISSIIRGTIGSPDLKKTLHEIILTLLGVKDDYTCERQYPLKLVNYNPIPPLNVGVRRTPIPGIFYRNYIGSNYLSFQEQLDERILSYLSNEFVPEEGDPEKEG